MTTLTPDRATALAAGAALLAAVAAPVRQNWRRKPRDGFPFSYYPMFTARRKRHGEVVHLLGIDADGGRHLLPHHYAGTGGLNQVRRQLARAVREGRGEEVAAQVARALAVRGRNADAAVVQVRVVTGRYAYDAFFAGDRDPAREIVHAVAAVPPRRRADERSRPAAQQEVRR